MSREPALYLEDIESSCRKIVHYTDGLEREEVFRDEMRFEAVLFNLHVIGEAVKRLPDELRQRDDTIPWRQIAGLRDFVAHAYFALDLDILWSAIREEVPRLLARIAELRQVEGL